jgi:superfamily II DNA or RNA helicase
MTSNRLSFLDYQWPLGYYDSDDINLFESIVLPTMERCSEYSRSVAYLKQSFLADSALGLMSAAENKANLRFLIGSPLSSAELEAIKAGLESKAVHEVANELRNSLNEASLESGDGLHLALLQYLIAEGFLDIKLCLRENGLHHQKTRIAKDVLGNTVVTLGSDNDSRSALGGNNRESGNLHANWLISEDEWARNAEPALKKFELDWNDKNPNSVSVPLDEQIRLGIKEDWQDRNISPDDLLAKLRALYKKLRHVTDVGEFVLRPHQERAKDAWQNNNWKGILAHCTGAGKTITSLYCAYKLADQYRHNNKAFFTVVAVPFQILAEQWASQIDTSRFDVIHCWDSYATWYDPLKRKLLLLASGKHDEKSTFLVVVNRTLKTERFQSMLKQIPPSSLFFVADEVHRHGGEGFAEFIPRDARFRLGLSATPWSVSESEREARLIDIYGSVVDEYGLEAALHDNVLCPYHYKTVQVTLDDEEQAIYTRASVDIASVMQKNKSAWSQVDLDKYRKAVRTRNALVGSCRSKFRWLEHNAPELKEKNVLFYCGDGRSGDDVDTLDRTVSRVSSILYASGWRVGRITASESYYARKVTLEEFAKGYFDCILAMKVLDEGFDLPSCETAYLMASSRNERQFVQRRGRVLRQSKETGKSHANIVDFIVLPSNPDSESSRLLVRAELIRAVEFARFSIDSESDLKELESIADSFDLNFESIVDDVSSRRFMEDEDVLDVES